MKNNILPIVLGVGGLAAVFLLSGKRKEAEEATGDPDDDWTEEEEPDGLGSGWTVDGRDIPNRPDPNASRARTDRAGVQGSGAGQAGTTTQVNYLSFNNLTPKSPVQFGVDNNYEGWNSSQLEQLAQQGLLRIGFAQVPYVRMDMVSEWANAREMWATAHISESAHNLINNRLRYNLVGDADRAIKQLRLDYSAIQILAQYRNPDWSEFSEFFPTPGTNTAALLASYANVSGFADLLNQNLAAGFPTLWNPYTAFKPNTGSGYGLHWTDKFCAHILYQFAIKQAQQPHSPNTPRDAYRAAVLRARSIINTRV